jgi:hypothetical protein
MPRGTFIPRTLRRFILLSAALAGPALPRLCAAEEAAQAPTTTQTPVTKDGVAVGFALHRFQDDFGVGLVAASPTFLRWLRVSARGGVAWYPHAVSSDGTSSWEAFYYGNLAVESGPPFLAGTGGAVRPYGFGGPIVVVPPSALSTASVALGGVGGFGLEARFGGGPAGEGPVTYFFELGGIGTGAIANKLPTRDSLASGFFLAAGIRLYP